MRARDAVAALAIALAVSLLPLVPLADRLEGLSLDALTWLRHQTFAPRHAPADSPTVVIAIDEATYRSPPFQNVPRVFWTREIGQVLDAVVEGGANVVGFDVIFPTSVERYIRGFDRDFLLALRRAARAGKVVLGKVQHSEKPIAPHAGQSFAVRHGRNIRTVNLVEDTDGVIRRIPLFLTAEGVAGKTRQEPSLALELAARSLNVRPEGAGGGVALAGYRIPGSAGNAMAVDFDTQPGALPTYSLADLQACAAAGDGDYFARHFAGKVVLLGVVVDVEDRKLTTMRYATSADGSATPPACRDDSAAPPQSVARDTIAGVYIHAQAVNNLLRGEALIELGPLAYWLWSLPLTLLAALLAMLLRPLPAGSVLVLGGAGWTALATVAFRSGAVLPLFDPLLSGGLSFAALLGYRFAVSDRDRRLLRRSFALYLAPVVIDRMVAGQRLPELGGETRQLSVWFSDIEKFSGLSEGLAPAELVRFLNVYLSAMSDIVEEHGGFVDKYIGDAIVAVFGAPHEDPDHALNAVRSALACRQRLSAMQAELGLPAGSTLNARIGINTGEILVGNIGSHRRFNYTVMGDAVNLASRLEGVNKIYGSQIIASGETVAACGDSIAFRELDSVRVVGRETPVVIFEALSAADGCPAESRDRAVAYEAALAAYRERRFEDAAAAFEDLAQAGDEAARTLAGRARAFVQAAPLPEWQGVTALDSK
ncbi:MAG: adenylate/guanylate cyclase domain-containing protein [Alphaproteobacteria bacterium]|jgi:adenylate cyclase/guanylate cyclase|nr:adenylate/guanylate cyclase domain-containing protein [Alphaproteobacteria bacterium]